jgi:superoxide dismutase, Cu-Zn family
VAFVNDVSIQRKQVPVMKKSFLLSLMPILALVACQPDGDDRIHNDTRTPTSSRDATPLPVADQDSSPVRMARAQIAATAGNQASGEVQFVEQDGTVRIDAKLRGLAPGAHGFHIHEKGDCSAPDASSAGDHFSPDDSPHGSPRDLPHARHVGDLGNLIAEENGIAEGFLEVAEVRLDGSDSIIGKAVVVHGGQDDFETQPSGDAGDPVGCGVIEAVTAGTG